MAVKKKKKPEKKWRYENKKKTKALRNISKNESKVDTSKLGPRGQYIVEKVRTGKKRLRGGGKLTAGVTYSKSGTQVYNSKRQSVTVTEIKPKKKSTVKKRKKKK